MILCPSLKSIINAARVLFAVCAIAANADDTEWQLHGAFTQGLVYTSDNHFYGPSDDSVSAKFTEASINGSARLLPNLRAAGQLAYRQAGAQGEGGGLDYAFVDYQFANESTYNAGIWAGRYRLPLGLYNETRDVAFTRPSIYLPQSVYPDRARNLQLSGDGALFYSNFFTNSAQWTTELFVGRPRMDEKMVQRTFSFIPGKVDDLDETSAYGARLMYTSSDGAWQAAFSRAHAKLNYTQTLPLDWTQALAVIAPKSGVSPSSPNVDIDVDFIYWLASLQCNIDQWSFTSEYGHIEIELSSHGVSYTLHPLFYYVQATRHLGPRWSVYGRYDGSYWDRRDRSGREYAALTQNPSYANFAHDYGIGVRHDINSRTMISAEYHYIDGTGWLTGMPDTSKQIRYWNMVAAEFSYRF